MNGECSVLARSLALRIIVKSNVFILTRGTLLVVFVLGSTRGALFGVFYEQLPRVRSQKKIHRKSALAPETFVVF